MKFFSQFLITGMLACSLQLFFPWWALVGVAFIVGLFYLYRHSFSSFLAGFLAGGLLWSGYALYLNWLNMGVLAGRMGDLFQGIESTGILIATALIAGIMCGLGALTGSLLRRTIFPPKDLDAVQS